MISRPLSHPFVLWDLPPRFLVCRFESITTPKVVTVNRKGSSLYQHSSVSPRSEKISHGCRRDVAGAIGCEREKPPETSPTCLLERVVMRAGSSDSSRYNGAPSSGLWSDFKHNYSANPVIRDSAKTSVV